MSGVLPFLKEDPELPDFYNMKVIYLNGKSEEFELASHFLNKELSVLEFVTKQDIWNWVSMDNVNRIEFDKNFSKMVEIRRRKMNE